MKSDGLIRLASDLVAIPSVNPMGSLDPKITGEARVVSYLTDFLRGLKLDIKKQTVEPGRDNLLAVFAPRQARQTLLLAPHTDTVSVENMTIDPFGAKIRGGKLYGRGACDTKGSMACMLWALKNFIQSPAARSCRTQIVLGALMGEENGNEGAHFLMESGWRADFAIAGEPTGLDIVHTHKGALWFKLVTHGKTAHGAMPERGRNAIVSMAQAVTYLAGDYTTALTQKKHRVLGSPTVSVGTIHGGQQVNIVADQCEISVDRRTIPGESHPKILADLRKALARKGVMAQTKVIRDCQPLNTNPRHSLVNALSQSARKFSRAGQPVGAPWFCDAAIMAQHEIPSVAFGPGHIAQAHTADEFIELKQLERGAEIFLDFFRHL